MARLLLVSPDASTGSPPSAPPLASLALLAHDVRVTLPDAHALTEAVRADAVLIDARRDLAAARLVCRLITASGSGIPTLLILTEGGFATVTNEWGVSDVMLDSASPVELDARVRLLVSASVGEGVVSVGGITIDESAYHASLQGRQLDLTYTEFELLKYLVQHPGRVFSREQLLSDV